MTKREIASLAIKLMGVFILINTISYVPMSFTMFNQILFQDHLVIGLRILAGIVAVFISVIPLVFALLIILLSDKAAKWLIKSDDDKLVQMGGSVCKEDIMLVVFSCIGLYLIVKTFPNLILNISRFVDQSASSYSVTHRTVTFYGITTLVVPVIQIAIGIWLFAGSKGIVKLWQKIRS